MINAQSSYTVMFIDFVGSTRLYDLLGNLEANATVDQVMSLVASLVEQGQGTVIKTIGDELMCCFEKADDAINTACRIQSRVDDLPPRGEFNIAVRIGLHYGEALIMDDGDLYGDAVNVAARMAGLSRARQIIFSMQTMNQLAPALKMQSRILDHVSVKGKKDKITICQMLWEPLDATFMSPEIELFEDDEGDSECRLHYNHREYRVCADEPCLMLGRGEQCDLVIDADHASRSHARIEYRRGKYVLVDQSTNGTFVTLADGREVYLRREEMTLWGEGTISIGTLRDKHSRSTVYFYS